MPKKKLRFAALVGIALLAVGAISFVLVKSSGPGSNRIVRLADGSTLELRQVACSNGFQYQHKSGNRLQRLLAPLAPVLPTYITKRFLSVSGGSVGFSGDGNTNLFVVTVNSSRAPGWWSNLGRLVVFDEQGNTYDACFGASTLGMPGEVAHGWQIHAFPRRNKSLGLRLISRGLLGRWEPVAEFGIPNPVFQAFPQWTPDPWPATNGDGNLVVILKSFESGALFHSDHGAGDDRTTPRLTRVVFGFEQNGRSTTNWAVQKITISDATGNRWSPLLGYELGKVTNGAVEFLGALWPGEKAWKLDVEFVRTGGFAPEEVWESPALSLPAVGVDTNLNARFERDGVSVRLVGLAAPQTDHPEPFKWIAKYWGNEDKDKIISLTVQILPELGKRRLKLLRAVDQNGREAQLVEHRNEDSAEQALLLKPADGAVELRLTFALQRSRFVQFLARPEFVADRATNSAGTRQGTPTE